MYRHQVVRFHGPSVDRHYLCVGFITGDLKLQPIDVECRCKVRMSGLCKVEMSGLMVGRGADGNRADSDESTRAGPVASVARDKAKTFDATRSGTAAESDRPPGAADAGPRWRTGRQRDRSSVTWPAVEPQIGSAI